MLWRLYSQTDSTSCTLSRSSSQVKSLSLTVYQIWQIAPLLYMFLPLLWLGHAPRTFIVLAHRGPFTSQQRLLCIASALNRILFLFGFPLLPLPHPPWLIAPPPPKPVPAGRSAVSFFLRVRSVSCLPTGEGRGNPLRKHRFSRSTLACSDLPQ